MRKRIDSLPQMFLSMRMLSITSQRDLKGVNSGFFSQMKRVMDGSISWKLPSTQNPFSVHTLLLLLPTTPRVLAFTLSLPPHDHRSVATVPNVTSVFRTGKKGKKDMQCQLHLSFFYQDKIKFSETLYQTNNAHFSSP